MAKFPEDYRPNHLCMPSNVEKTFQSRFFYPNMCHVCHCLESETIKLKRCSNCNMISYCSKEHQQEHWYLHKEFCRVVSIYLKANGTNNLFEFMKTIKDPHDRFNAKAMLLSMLRKKMNRDLYDFENQMILYPRMCEICFETNPDLLVNCQFCPQGSFCTRHNDKSQHDEICFFYTICYTSDFYLFCDESCRIIPAMKYVLFNEEDNFKMPENMSMFLQEYITEVPLIWMDLTKYDYWVYVSSEFFSKPLTMMYVLEQLNFKVKSTLTVHIIGLAASMEYEFLSMETILHLLKQLKTLNIILISPSLIERIEETSQQVNVCSQCVEKEKNFSITGYKMPYSSYVNSRSFKSPDIIISYDLGDLKCQLWDESLMEMKKIPAPFLVTNNTLPRALNYQKRMDDLLNYLTSDVHIQKNPFGSTWPYRNEVDDLLNLHNNYFSVYTLHNIDRDNQQQQQQQNQQRTNQSSENIPEEEVNENNENVNEKCSNKSDKMEDAPSASNSNQGVENPDSEKLKKKKKKKKTNQSPDVSRSISSNNNVAPEIPNETPSKNDDTPQNDEQIVDLTFQLSQTNIQENEGNIDAKSESNIEKKKKKSKKKKSKSDVDPDSESSIPVQSNISEDAENIKSQENKLENKTEEVKEEEKESKTEEAKKGKEIDMKKENKIEEKEEKNIETKDENKSVEANEEDKIEGREIKRKKKKKSKKQASTSNNIESEGAAGLQIKIAHSKCVENSSVTMKSANEESQSQYLFGHPPSEETLEQLVDENKRLFVTVEQIAEEYKMLKVTGKQTATSMLQEMECLRMSLENIEEKIMTMFPGEFD